MADINIFRGVNSIKFYNRFIELDSDFANAHDLITKYKSLRSSKLIKLFVKIHNSLSSHKLEI